MAEEYTRQSLDIIEHNNLLEPDELGALENIRADLDHNFWVGQVFRSRVEMEISVLSDLKYPTADSKYWQSIREQNVHFGELVSLSYEYRKNVQRVKILEAEVREMTAKLDKAKLDSEPEYSIDIVEAEIEIKVIDTEKTKWILIGQTRVGKNRIREILNWQDIINKLKPIIKFSKDTYEEHQLSSYIRRFENRTKVKQVMGKIEEGNDLFGQHATTQRVIDGRGIALGSTASKTAMPIKSHITDKELGNGIN